MTAPLLTPLADVDAAALAADLADRILSFDPAQARRQRQRPLRGHDEQALSDALARGLERGLRAGATVAGETAEAPFALREALRTEAQAQLARFRCVRGEMDDVRPFDSEDAATLAVQLVTSGLAQALTASGLTATPVVRTVARAGDGMAAPVAAPVARSVR